MSSISSAELNCWGNKEFDACFGTADLDFEHASEATSFFDLGFDHDQDVFDSSDASVSVEFNFFNDIDLGSTFTHASVFSSTVEDQSSIASDCNVYSIRNASRRPDQTVSTTAIPQSQKLVHRLRPEGVAISNADLLSIEGRKQTPSDRISQSRTPPAVPQFRSGVITPKTPRTPKERGSRISKATPASMHSPKKAMHPSNYYASPQTPSLREWQDRVHQFGIQQLPLTPPPSTSIQQKARGGSPLMDSPTPASAVPVTRRMSSSSPLPSPIPMHQPSRQSLEHDATHLAPLAAWTEAANNEIAFSPLSPIISDAPWSTNTVAHMHNRQFEAFPNTSPLSIGGLMIDFGDADNLFNQPLSQSFTENYDLTQSDPLTYFSIPRAELQQNHIRNLDSTTSFPQFHPTPFPSRSLTPSPKSHTRPPPPPTTTYSSHTFPRTKRQIPSILPTHNQHHTHKTPAGPETPAMSTSRSTSSHRRANSNSTSTKVNGVTKPKARTVVQASGDMFVNFTPSDSRRILTGVAPSGSSKTKARREKEAREERRKMSEAARRAVMQAGGDWEGLEGLVGEGGQRREVEC